MRGAGGGDVELTGDGSGDQRLPALSEEGELAICTSDQVCMDLLSLPHLTGNACLLSGIRRPSNGKIRQILHPKRGLSRVGSSGKERLAFELARGNPSNEEARVDVWPQAD